jgi:excisionase family DNA binding protein
MQTEINANRTFQPLLDAEQAAALLGLHPKTLLRKSREGAIPSFRIFGKIRFTESALAEWVAAQTAGPKMAA